MKVFFFSLLLVLLYGPATARAKQIVVRVEHGPGADSLLAEALRIEPRLGQASITNDRGTTLSFPVRAAEDTANAPVLKTLAGKVIQCDIFLLGATGVRGGDLWIGYDGERLTPLAVAWGRAIADFMTAAELNKAPGTMRLSFGAPGKPSLPDSLLLCRIRLWRSGDSPGRNLWGHSSIFTDKLEPKVIFRETPVGPEVKIEAIKP